MRRACLIVNPHAGGGRAARVLPAVEAELRSLRVAFRVEHTLSLEHAVELGREAVRAGEVAVSLGGDGMAGAVAHALRGTDALLGVLPGGRGNDFARKLGIPSEPERACAVLAHGVERTIDVADVEGRTFLGIASYGFDSEVQDIANATKAIKGRTVYLYATLRALAAWRPVTLTCSADGAPERRFVGYAVAACNTGMFGGGMVLAPDADLGDGLLDVVVTGHVPKVRFLRTLPKVFDGTHLDDDAVELFRARELRVGAERPFRIYADGDPIATTPATIRVVPHALRVLVPA